MKFKTAIKSLSAVAALALAGCMNAGEESPRASNAKQMTFAREIGVATANAARVSTTPGFDAQETAKAFEKLGCPKLAALFNDFNDVPASGNGELPASLKNVLSCGNITAGVNDLEARDEIQKVFEGDIQSLLDCLCGGEPGTLSFTSIQTQTFDAASSKAASTSFDASSSKAASGSFDASKSKAGSGFDASGSKTVSGGFKVD